MRAAASALRSVAGVLAASGGLVWWAGLNALDPLVLVPFACLSVVWVASWAATPLAGPEARRLLAESGREPATLPASVALPAAGAGCLIGLLLTASAVGLVNVTNWHGHWLLPSPFTVAAAGLASLSASLLVAWWSILVAMDSADAHAARVAMRVRFAIGLGAWVAAREYAPVECTEWLAGFATTHGIARMALIGALAALVVSWWLSRLAVRRVVGWAAGPGGGS
jgi:hypothetical protein